MLGCRTGLHSKLPIFSQFVFILESRLYGLRQENRSTGSAHILNPEMVGDVGIPDVVQDYEGVLGENALQRSSCTGQSRHGLHQTTHVENAEGSMQGVKNCD